MQCERMLSPLQLIKGIIVLMYVCSVSAVYKRTGPDVCIVSAVYAV